MSNKTSSSLVFLNPGGRILNIEALLEEIKCYISRDPSAFYEIVIGSDSRASAVTSFITAVVVRKIGNGGIYFYTRSREEHVRTMRDRIWKETMLSITLAEELRSRIKDVMGEEIFWDRRIEFRHIHIDVGEFGPTRDLIDSVKGIVKGFGFEPVIKPYSYGAFVVADLHT